MSNIPHPPRSLASPNDLTRRAIHEKAVADHLTRIHKEFHAGFEFLQKYPKSVTIFGSSMTPPESVYYKHASELAHKIAKELNYAIITGGGPGIMEAAAKGAQEAGGNAVGLRIHLLREREPNPYNTDSMDFTYFFSRKTMLTFAAEAYIFFPGGYGTFDELFSILTLIQTLKIPRVPVILYGSAFWNPLKEFIQKNMLGAEIKTIDFADINLFEITDDPARIIEIIHRAPVSEWWRSIN